jgi:glucose-6-phosphate dehydrogenase assembly protein OpcA
MAKRTAKKRRSKRLTAAEKRQAGLAQEKIAKKKPAKKATPAKVTPKRAEDRSNAMSRITQYREALQEALTIPDLKAIMKVVIKKAKGGNMDAIKIVLERAVGKPVQPTAAVQQDAATLAAEARDFMKAYF